MFEGMKCVQNKIVFKSVHISDYDNDFAGI